MIFLYSVYTLYIIHTRKYLSHCRILFTLFILFTLQKICHIALFCSHSYILFTLQNISDIFIFCSHSIYYSHCKIFVTLLYFVHTPVYYSVIYNVLSFLSLESRVCGHQIVPTNSKEQNLEHFSIPSPHSSLSLSLSLSNNQIFGVLLGVTYTMMQHIL